MSLEQRIDLALLLSGFIGMGIGFFLGVIRERDRLKEAQKRADWAYNRYWLGDDGELF